MAGKKRIPAGVRLASNKQLWRLNHEGLLQLRAEPDFDGVVTAEVASGLIAGLAAKQEPGGLIRGDRVVSREVVRLAMRYAWTFYPTFYPGNGHIGPGAAFIEECAKPRKARCRGEGVPVPAPTPIKEIELVRGGTQTRRCQEVRIGFGRARVPTGGLTSR